MRHWPSCSVDDKEDVMSQFLRFAAMVVFIIGVIVCIVDDTPDVIDLFMTAFVGLALWVGSTLVPERLA